MIENAAQTAAKKPRLGFLGIGWIGRNRMESISNQNLGEIAAITEPNREMAEKAREIAPDAQVFSTFDELLDSGIDGLAIATPSALHAEQAIAALDRGISVFCQKPLARNADETRRVIETAKKNDCLLAVDFSYRYISGVGKIREMIQSGELGKIFAADLVFHNAYGPDKNWFFDKKLSGGGCVIDLGIHLVDLALWMMDFPSFINVSSSLYADGKPLEWQPETVEDYAAAQFDLKNGASARMSCSWNLNAGCEAIISATFYGTKGGAALRNLNGSFFDFTTEFFDKTSRNTISEPDDNSKNWNWGGQAAIDWARRLAMGEKFDPSSEKIIDVAAAIDAVYAGKF